MEINAIYAQFNQVLFKYILVRVNNADDTADILQEVFLKISTKLNSLADKQKLKSWIFSIAKNAIIDHYRKNKKNQVIDLDENQIEIIDETASSEPDGLEKCLVNFIEKLPEDYRNIIIDSEIKGIKQKDLAEKYNLAYPSVRSRVQRGRTKLKEMLLCCCKVELDNRGGVFEVSSKKNCEKSCD